MLISTAFLQWLEDASWSVSIRQSSWIYPALEIIHIIGIALVAGSAFLFDLRILGSSKQVPLKMLEGHLLSWSIKGLFFILPSGLLLFIANAVTLGNDPVFWIKMGLLILAGLNALVFHYTTLRLSRNRNITIAIPAGVKFAAVFSIILWVAVIACGRLLAY